MKTESRHWFLFTGIACALLVGCAHERPVPNELAEARAVCARASSGPAVRYAPERLERAKQALADAEWAHRTASPGEVQDRSYIALRRAEAAEAEASTVVAAERRTAALQQLATLTGVHADRARAELAAAAAKAAPVPPRPELARAPGATDQARPSQAAAASEAREKIPARLPDDSRPAGLTAARVVQPAAAPARPAPAPGPSTAAPVAAVPTPATALPTTTTPTPAAVPARPRPPANAPASTLPLGPADLVPPPTTFDAPPEHPVAPPH